MLPKLSVLFLSTLLLKGKEITRIDFAKRWNDTIPLANPHKGWYHHYYDNSLTKYLAKNDAELTAVPGLDHLYLRFPWSYLEPKEGEFNWAIIDDIVDKWSPKGVGFSLRITCKETGLKPREQKFATPEWVRTAGAQGGFYRKKKEARLGKDNFPWEPNYGDPIFLEKLEAMIKALANRYDGHPHLRYVDIGSLGDWGEGHTSSGSGKTYSAAVRMKHLQIHQRHFKKTTIVATDDFLRGADAEQTKSLHQHAIEQKLGLRDDSIFVDYWCRTHPKTYSVAEPELFKQGARSAPTILETQHLRDLLRSGNWEGQQGSTLAKLSISGPEFLTNATRLLKATYLGYHGSAKQWLSLKENPKLSEQLLNLCGYWYFPHQVSLPKTLSRSNQNTLSIRWENRGLARAYHPYQIIFRFNDNPHTDVILPSGNLDWLPAQTIDQPYQLLLPENLSPGLHSLSVRLYSSQLSRPVHLPIAKAREDGFISLGEIMIKDH